MTHLRSLTPPRLSVRDVIATCRELGYACRYDVTYAEYRLTKLTSAFRGTRLQQLEQAELAAYYTTSGRDCLDTARAWAAQVAPLDLDSWEPQEVMIRALTRTGWEDGQD